MMRGTPAIYFKSLNRPFTVLGVDRSLFYLFVGLCLAIAFSARLSITMDIAAGLVFVVLHVIGVLVTRVDTRILAVYRRHIHYQTYYAAQAGIHSRIPLVKPSVPVYQGQRGLV
jgi:type IV secretory pathway TrbD component